MSEITQEASVIPVLPVEETGGVVTVTGVEPETQNGERRVTDMSLDELLAATSAAATEQVRGLYAQVVEGGNAHVALAEQAARTHLEGAHAAAGDLRTAMGRTQADIDTANSAKLKEFEERAKQLTERAAQDALAQGEELVGKLQIAAAHVVGQINSTAAELKVTQEAAADTLAETRSTLTEAKAAAGEVQETTRALLEVRETVVRTAVTDALIQMAEGGDPTALELIKNATASLDDGARHVNAPLLLALVKAGVPAYLHGEAGSGKSTGARLTAKDLGIPFHDMSMGITTGKADFFGFKDANGTVHETPLRRAAQHGGVMLFDEMDSGNPTATTYVNATLANGHSVFPDGSMPHHRNTRFVAAANTIGKGANAQYVGRNRLDAATLDRFGFVRWDTDPVLEETLVLGHAITPQAEIDLQAGGVPTAREWLDMVRNYREASASLTLGHLVTPRAALYGKQLIELDLGNGKTGVGMTHLVGMLIHKGINDSDKSRWESRANPRRR